jgi:hypothetical protein
MITLLRRSQKIDVFIRACLGAYQSNPNEYENYRGRKGNEAY